LVVLLRSFRTHALFALTAGLIATVSTTRASLIAELTIQSQSGDFIGQGQTKDIIYTPANSTFFSDQILSSQNVAGQPAFLRFTLGTVTGSNTTNTFSTLDFATNQLGLPLLPGTYGLPGNTAQRASFASAGHAGLDVSFQNRGSNTLTGNFTVNSVSYFTDASSVRQIGSLDVNFEQHSEGATPALFGHFTFQNSAVPEPSALAVAGLAMTVLAARRRRVMGRVDEVPTGPV